MMEEFTFTPPALQVLVAWGVSMVVLLIGVINWVYYFKQGNGRMLRVMFIVIGITLGAYFISYWLTGACQDFMRTCRTKAAAAQAESEDWQAAHKQTMAELPAEWKSIERILRASDLHSGARLAYVLNVLEQEPVTKISLNQHLELMNILPDAYHNSEEAKHKRAICEATILHVDPFKTDALDAFREQQNAGKYDPNNYREKEE